MTFLFLLFSPQVEPDIQQYDMVHHMLLYRCPSFVTEAYDRPCYRGDLGDACHDVVAAWGKGGGVREVPPPSGSVGGIVISSAVYVLIRRSGFRTTWVFPSEVRAGTCFIGWKSTTIIQTMKQVSAAIMNYSILRSMFKSEYAAFLCVAVNSGLGHVLCRQDR